MDQYTNLDVYYHGQKQSRGVLPVKLIDIWRRLREKRITFISVPTDGSATHSVTVACSSLLIAVLLASSLIAGGIGLVYYSYSQIKKTAALSAQLAVQELRNRELREEMKNQAEQIEYLSNRVVTMEAALLTLKDYSYEINELLKRIGVSGVERIPQLDTAAFNGKGGPLLQVVASKLDSIEQTVPEHQRNLREVYEALKKRIHRLEHTPSIWPAQGWVSSPFGHRVDPFTGRRAFHEGIDIANHKGTRIVAAASGTVTYAGYMGGYGKVVIIDHGYGIETRYGHNQEIKVRKGESVSKGQLIALMGSTGRSTGAHLHYEVRINGTPVSPWKYLPKE